MVSVACLALASSLFSAQAEVDGATVSVNGTKVFRFKTSNWGISPEIIAKRVANNLASASGKVAVRKSESNYLLVMNGKPVVTITPKEAKAWGISGRKLAYTWAGELKRALSIAPLKIGKKNLYMGIGDVAEVAVAGKLSSDARITSSDPSFLSIERKNWGFMARAIRPGNGFVTVSAGGQTQQLNFEIKPYAATFPDQVTAYVAGRPAISGTVKGAIEGAIKQQTKFAPLAKTTIEYENIPAIGTSMSLGVPVKVKITAPGTMEREGTLTVKVVNIGLQKQSDDVLWYCNDPERITKMQNLFSGTLAREKSARLLYHHINDSPQPMIVRSLILNESDVPAKVLVIPGDSSPDKDPVGAGMRAGDQFFRALVNGSGEVITIEPKSSVPISFRRLKPQDVISGLCSIRLIEGPESLLVRADSFPPVEVEPRWRPALTSSTPWREVGSQEIREWDRLPFTISDHIYPDPYRTENVEYKVGGRYSVIRLGQKAIAKQGDSGRLDGNFGVSYGIEINLSNPEEETTDVEIVFETSAGYSGGIFFVDGEYMITPKMLPKKEARLAKFRMAPGASRKVKIETIPLSGSSYPATIFIRPVSAFAGNQVIELSKPR